MKNKQPDVIPVLITKKDLKDGHYLDNCGCPLHSALTRLGYPVGAVGGFTVDLFGGVDNYAIFEEGEDPDVQSPIYLATLEQEPILVHLLKI